MSRNSNDKIFIILSIPHIRDIIYCGFQPIVCIRYSRLLLNCNCSSAKFKCVNPDNSSFLRQLLSLFFIIHCISTPIYLFPMYAEHLIAVYEIIFLSCVVSPTCWYNIDIVVCHSYRFHISLTTLILILLQVIRGDGNKVHSNIQLVILSLFNNNIGSSEKISQKSKVITDNCCDSARYFLQLQIEISCPWQSILETLLLSSLFFCYLFGIWIVLIACHCITCPLCRKSTSESRLNSKVCNQ